MSEPPVPVRRAAFAWWGATACWFLGSLLGRLLGERDALPATSLPTPVAVLAFVIAGGLWASLVYGVYRGARWARVVLAIVGTLGVLDLVLQLFTLFASSARDTGDLVRGLAFLLSLGLSLAGFTLMFRTDAAADHRAP
jgi:branched-subunit amino acid ABC-type transport system permease component